MKREITVLLLSIAALGFVLFRTLQEGRWAMLGPGTHSLKEEIGAVKAAVKKEDIHKLEIRRCDDIVVFSRSAGGLWKIVNPIEAQADSEKIEEMLSLLLAKEDPAKLRIPIGKEPAVQEATLANFGMTKPALGLVFQGNFGEQALWLGQKAPQDQGIYAHWTQEKYIELVPDRLGDLLAASVEDLREHRIFYVPEAPIAEVQFRKKGQSLQLLADGKAILRSGDQDVDETEIVHRADPKVRQEVFDFLENVRCKEFWDGESQILGRESLMKIRLTRRNTGAAEETWLLEKVSTANGEKWTVEGAPGKGKYVVDSEAFGKYVKDLSWILDRGWTEIVPQDCRTLSLQMGSEGIALRSRDGVWESPEGKAWRVDQAKVKQFLEKSLALRATELVPCRELPAQGGICLEIGDAKSRTQVFLEEHAGHWTMHRKGDPFLFRLESPGVDFRACLNALYWRDTTVLDWQPQDVSILRLIRPEGQDEFAKKDGIWRLVRPRTGDVDQQALGKALSALLPLQASRFLSAGEIEKIGKFKLRLKVLVSLPTGQTREIWIGRPGPDGAPVKLAGGGDVFLVPDRVVNAVLRDPIYFVTVLEEDSNRNGKTDQWIHYRHGRKQWMESDADEDGKMDSKTYWVYNRQGDLIRVDTDTNNDGVIDQRTYVVNGMPYRQEDDTRGTGHTDLWTTFRKGVQVRQRWDKDGDGKPDVIKKILRNSAGEIVGADVDENKDGKPDYREKYEGTKVVRVNLKSGSSH